MGQPPLVAYFSMEVGLESGMPTYSGGLGVLAGDTIRSAADLEVPMVAVSLLHRFIGQGKPIHEVPFRRVIVFVVTAHHESRRTFFLRCKYSAPLHARLFYRTDATQPKRELGL